MLKINTIMLIALSALISSHAYAVDFEAQIEARQGQMKLYQVNMDFLGDMLDRKLPYNKQTAKFAADNLLALSKLKSGHLWPRGSGMDNEKLQDKTSAKADIWLNPQQVSDLQQDLVEAMENLVYGADWSMDWLRGGMKKVNKACKACHKEFRSKK